MQSDYKKYVTPVGPATSYLLGAPPAEPKRKPAKRKTSLSNASVCFTGRFDMGLQGQAAALAKRAGGQAFERVGGGLDFLVVGNKGSKTWVRENEGRKMIKAASLFERYGKPQTITENEFRKMVGE